MQRLVLKLTFPFKLKSKVLKKILDISKIVFKLKRKLNEICPFLLCDAVQKIFYCF